MSLTVNAKTFVPNSFGPTAITYFGPAHTVSALDDIRLAYVAPKPTSVFSGVGRTSVKLSRTVPLTGALTPTGVMIVEINVSSPVGAASADIDAALNDTGSHLSGATQKTIVKNQQISF